MYVGRVSREKNVEAFLELTVPGTKYVIGDGPARRNCNAVIPRRAFRGR